MNKHQFKTEEEAMAKLDEFNYDPEKEKDGPVVTDESSVKTLIAFYKVSEIVCKPEFVLATIKFMQEWVKTELNTDA